MAFLPGQPPTNPSTAVRAVTASRTQSRLATRREEPAGAWTHCVLDLPFRSLGAKRQEEMGRWHRETRGSVPVSRSLLGHTQVGEASGLLRTGCRPSMWLGHATHPPEGVTTPEWPTNPSLRPSSLEGARPQASAHSQGCEGVSLDGP